MTDPELSLAEGALGGSKAGAFFTEADGQHMATLRIASGHDLKGPWRELPARVRELAMEGTGSTEYEVEWSFRRGNRSGTHQFVGPWEGFLQLVEKEALRRGATKTGKAWLDVLEPVTCGSCEGVGLGQKPRMVRLGLLSIADALELPVAELVERLAAEAALHGAWGELGAALGERSRALSSLGLGELPLNTRASELSVSQLQRVRLASVLFSGLSGATVVLDEPDAGLGDEELPGLVAHLERLIAEGNTVLMVTHRPELVGAAEHVVRLGPGAGSAGGTIISGGSVETRGEVRRIEPGAERVVLSGDHDVPTSGLVILDGTLLETQRAFQDALSSDAWDQVVDARAGVQATMPLTAFGKMADLQKLFHAAAKDTDLPKAAFSFMSPKGRCPACSGSGADRVALDFMADLAVPCEACGGERYRPEVLAVKSGGRHVAEFLRVPVVDLGGTDGDLPAGLERARAAMVDVGLGHLSFGRRTSTLSGGEAQRLGLAVGLAATAGRTLCLLDQPGSGLSETDLAQLIETLRREAGKGVLFVATAHRGAVRRASSEMLVLG